MDCHMGNRTLVPMGQPRRVPLERLRPVRADPNKVLLYWRFTELTRPPAGERTDYGASSG